MATDSLIGVLTEEQFLFLQQHLEAGWQLDPLEHRAQLGGPQPERGPTVAEIDRSAQ